jgi:hypothetical protein
MKKLMLVMGLMAFAAISYAGEKAVDISKEIKVEKSIPAKTTKVQATDFTCTVTQTGKITVYFVEYTVSCSATESNCKLALASSSGCVTTALDNIKRAIIK